MQFRRVRSDLSLLVNGGNEPPISNELAEAYDRAFAFCPCHESLTQLAKEIRALMLEVLVPAGLCTKEDVPTHQAIILVARAIEPVSLKTLSKVNHGLRLILQHGELEPLKDLADFIHAEIGPRGFGANAYVLCLHELNPARADTRYGQFRAALIEKDSRLEGDRYYSSAVLAGTALQAHGPHLLAYLHDGYEISKPEPNKANAIRGSWKISERTARIIHEGMVALAEEHSVEAPAFDEIFSFGAQSGPRNGHSSRALPSSQGNLVRPPAAA